MNILTTPNTLSCRLLSFSSSKQHSHRQVLAHGKLSHHEQRGLICQRNGNSPTNSSGKEDLSTNVKFLASVGVLTATNLLVPSSGHARNSEMILKRESIEDFGPMLWYSSGTIGFLLEEIVSIYPYLSPPNLSNEQSSKVCNALALLQYGLRIFVVTSFKDTCYIEILPREQKSNRMITLSFWSEVHYNSIYPKGEFPVFEHKRKKRWWWH